MQPLGDLVALIEQSADIDVAVLDAGPDEHGLTMRDPQRGAVFIGVARTHRPMRQRSTLAHELGHVVLGDWVDSDAADRSQRPPAEIRADVFARHLLLPIDGLRGFLGDPRAITLATLSTVVQRFLVSPSIAAIALEQAGYIGKAVKREWMTTSALRLAVQFGWGDQYRALQADSDRRRAPQRLLARTIHGYVDGVLSAQVIANLRGVSLTGAVAELREAGIVPTPQVVTWVDPDELPEAHVDLTDLDVDLRATAEPSDTAAEPEGR
ncbi:ImmA/IrrE family metallo-endopeptidase [Krasilnikovia sp. MM14-A1004]|uniref:ImmA/IrrE family metallo-endopeptidase n=1 Tax=Krasilnikovia sp. MM14-A1004 TaxID=3373541 RepID=UPI00399C91DA